LTDLTTKRGTGLTTALVQELHASFTPCLRYTIMVTFIAAMKLSAVIPVVIGLAALLFAAWLLRLTEKGDCCQGVQLQDRQVTPTLQKRTSGNLDTSDETRWSLCGHSFFGLRRDLFPLTKNCTASMIVALPLSAFTACAHSLATTSIGWA
jgi:hypothetical protein